MKTQIEFSLIMECDEKVFLETGYLNYFARKIRFQALNHEYNLIDLTRG